jgi:hypothetical protein
MQIRIVRNYIKVMKLNTNRPIYVEFEVFTVVRIMFLVLVPCRLVSRCQRFSETSGLSIIETYFSFKFSCYEY